MVQKCIPIRHKSYSRGLKIKKHCEEQNLEEEIKPQKSPVGFTVKLIFTLNSPCTERVTDNEKLRNKGLEGQRWKLDNNKKLENKEGVWKSDDLWIFKTKGYDMIYIENTSKAKVLGAKYDGKVFQEFLVEGKADQLWKKGEPDAEGYFTLQNSVSLYHKPKVLTAISESSLEIKKDQYNPC